MISKLKNILFEKVDATGLAVFRIFYSTVLLAEIFQLYRYQNIIYDVVPFEHSGEINVNYIFFFWSISILLLMIGFYTRYMAIINYIFSIIIFSSAGAFEYHVFYGYVGINFLLIFMPSGKTLSIDYLTTKLKYSSPKKEFMPDTYVYAANYLIPIFIGLGLVYFDSILYKFTSEIWLKGLGMWMPANLPMATWTDSTWLMNNEYLVKFLGYFTICFESLFIFTFWHKALRWPYVVIGMSLHFGILYEFPIPWFALCAIALYILLIPVSFWKKVFNQIKAKNPIFIFLYDSECPLCAKTIIIIKFFDIFNCIKCESVQENAIKYSCLEKYSTDELLINIHGISKGKVFIGYYAYAQLFKSMVYTYPIGLLMSFPVFSKIGEAIYKKVAGNRITERCTDENCPLPTYSEPLANDADILLKGFNLDSISRKFWSFLLVFFISCQFIISWFSPLVQNTLLSIHIENSWINNTMSYVYEKTHYPLKKYFGFTEHPVFMDDHFHGYNHIIKVEKLTNGTYKNIGLLDENGLVDKIPQGALWVNYTWRVVNPKLDKERLEKGLTKYIALDRNKEQIVHYRISVKEIETPTNWEKNFLRKQMKKPWETAGYYTYEEGFNWTTRMNDIFLEESQNKESF